MILLAMDTSTSAITVAVHDDDRTLAERSIVDARRHTEHLSPLIAAVLADASLTPADVTDVAVGTGPGPFTGLRVGLVTARTFAFARGVPVHGVCSLDALAHEFARGHSGEFVVATDARRKEVYWSRYDGSAGRARRLNGPEVERPADLPIELGSLPAVGRGPVLYPETFGRAYEPRDVSASALADVALARIVSGVDMPVDALYLRRPDAAPAAAQQPKSTLALNRRGGRP